MTWSLVTGEYKASKGAARLNVEMMCEGGNVNSCRELYVDDVNFTALS